MRGVSPVQCRFIRIGVNSLWRDGIVHKNTKVRSGRNEC